MLSSSGSFSSFGPLLGYGSKTKLIFTMGIGGMRLAIRNSRSHNGITSSNERKSCPVLDTCPRYSVVHPEEHSSDTRIAVFGGIGTEGTSLDEGGLMGPCSKICNGVFGGEWLTISCRGSQYTIWRCWDRLTAGLVTISGMGLGPGVPKGKSVACLREALPKARKRPIKPLPPGVLGVCGDCGSMVFGVKPGAPQPEKSSGDGGIGPGVTDIDGRRPFNEK